MGRHSDIKAILLRILSENEVRAQRSISVIKHQKAVNEKLQQELNRIKEECILKSKADDEEFKLVYQEIMVEVDSLQRHLLEVQELQQSIRQDLRQSKAHHTTKRIVQNCQSSCSHAQDPKSWDISRRDSSNSSRIRDNQTYLKAGTDVETTTTEEDERGGGDDYDGDENYNSNCSTTTEDNYTDEETTVFSDPYAFRHNFTKLWTTARKYFTNEECEFFLSEMK